MFSLLIISPYKFYIRMRNKSITFSLSNKGTVPFVCILFDNLKLCPNQMLGKVLFGKVPVLHNLFNGSRPYLLIYFVPNNLSPASPKPGTIYACSFNFHQY